VTKYFDPWKDQLWETLFQKYQGDSSPVKERKRWQKAELTGKIVLQNELGNLNYPSDINYDMQSKKLMRSIKVPIKRIE